MRKFLLRLYTIYHRISDQIGSVLYKDSGNERRNIGPLPSLKNKKRFKIKPEGGQKCVLSRIISFHKICTLDGRIKYALQYLVLVPKIVRLNKFIKIYLNSPPNVEVQTYIFNTPN